MDAVSELTQSVMRRDGMYQEKVRVTMRNGLYRDAMNVVQVANQYSSEVYIDKGRKSANAKSVLGMIALSIQPGDTVTVRAQGADAGHALKSLCHVIGVSMNIRNEY